MNTIPIRLAGADLLATHSGGLFWVETRALTVADLHLEKGSHLARRGAPLPPYDSRATLDLLGALLDRFRPETVVCLGDSFHDAQGPIRLSASDTERLAAMAANRDWIWVTGNHDSQVLGCPAGRTVAEVRFGPLIFRHQAIAGSGEGDAAGEVSGHLHPKAAVHIGGRRLTGRCFVSDGMRLIMPALGAYAGGLDVSSAAFRHLLAPSFTVYLAGTKRLHAISHRRLFDTTATS